MPGFGPLGSSPLADVGLPPTSTATPSFGTVWRSTTQSEQGLSRTFDGTTSGQRLQIDSTIYSAEPVTVDVWFRMSDASTNRMLVSACNSSGLVDFWGVGVNSSRGVFVYKQNDSVAASAAASSNGLVTLGRWYRITAVLASTSSRSVYLDGVLVASDSTSVPALRSPGRFVVGRVNASSYSAEAWAGDIAQVRVIGRALSAAEILSPLKVRWGSNWDFEGDDLDRIGGYHLTATNSPTWSRGPVLTVPTRRRVVVAYEAAAATSTYFPYYLHTNQTFGAFGLGHNTGLIAS